MDGEEELSEWTGMAEAEGGGGGCDGHHARRTTSTPTHPDNCDTSRVILHLDLDCFYCQVEQLRLGIQPGTPCAVQQWEGLIAVNYEARAQGVSRHMRVAEAQKVCPGIVLVHVETIGDQSGSGGEIGGGQHGQRQQAASQRSRLKEKACLERYRCASRAIIGLIHSTVADAAVIEKASIDEVYLDLTRMVDEELRIRGGRAGVCDGGGGAAALLGDCAADEEERGVTGGDGSEGGLCAWGSVVKGPSPLQAGSVLDRRLAVGAKICARLRGVVRRELGYSMSGGVAANKLLAKLASAMHKPNQQTVIPLRAVAGLMRELPLTKIGKMGGKLGAELQEMGAVSAGDVADLPLSALETKLGAQRARWVADAVRGIDGEAVVPKGPPKSMLAAKSFSATADMAAIQRWLGILADELAARMAQDEVAHKRRARNLVLHWRGGRGVGSTWGKERSRSGALPPGSLTGSVAARAAALTTAAIGLFARADDALPCSRLALSTTEFSSAPVQGKQSIQRFFAASPAAGSAEQPCNSLTPPTAPQKAAKRPTPSPVARVDSFPKWSAGFLLAALAQPRDRPPPTTTTTRPSTAGETTAAVASPASCAQQLSDGSGSGREGAADVMAVDSGATDGGGPSAGDVDMADVDVEEQRRILRDIALRRGGGGGKRAGGSLGGGRPTKKARDTAQRSITSMFSPTGRVPP